jgi:FMN-dependent NADH-azoreductase
MKKIIRRLSIYGSLAIAAAVFASAIELKAQTPAPAPAQTPAAAQGACTDDAKAAWYADFTANRTTQAAKAYEAAKKYLTACPQEEGQIPSYLKKWVAAYEKEARKLKFVPLLYGDKKFAEAYALGKEILADDPDNLQVLIGLGYGGYLATITSKNESFNNESLAYAHKALQLIESGKAPESWAPFKSKDDALAYLYNAIGRLTLKNNSPETLTSLIKAAQLESDVKKDPWIYFFIAAAYESGPYAKLSADYKAKCEGKDLTPECKLALENINQVVDRIVDAYARAVAFAGTDAKFQANKKEWMDSLATWYKYRHNDSDVGLTEMIASVMSKPLPPEPTPLTTLPATAPTTTTPTSGTVNSSPAATGTPVSATKTTTAPSTTPLTTAPKTAPAATATPTSPAKVTTSTAKATTKPKTRNNHRRRH